MKGFEIGDGGDGHVLIILLLALAALGLVAFILSRFYKKQGSDTPLFIPEEECCGAHEVCEKESLLTTTAVIDYYEDEELDRHANQGHQHYTVSDEEEFREILLTLQEEEVAGWLKSLQLRHIELPDPIKEEALLIIRERRFS